MGYITHFIYDYAMLDTTTAEQKEKLISLLRDIRKEAGLSQLQLANKLGMPQSFVSKYESGERRLDVLELRIICSALDMTLDAFVKKLERKLNAGS